jgi:protein SCO1/2
MLDRIGIEPKPGAQVPPDLVFRDERGRRVRMGDCFGDRPIVLNLVYFQCPMLCNMTMDGLIRTLKIVPFELGRDFDVLTVSFDPREGPQLAAGAKRTALKRYGRGGAEAWHFLTGDEASIRRLTEAVGFRYEFDPQIGQYAHAAGLIVLTPDGRVSRYLHGVEFPARDLRLSLVEASQGNIGTAADHVLLLCYQYNPATGKYGLAVQTATRVLGLTTLFCLLGGIAIMLRRERLRGNKK